MVIYVVVLFVSNRVSHRDKAKLLQKLLFFALMREFSTYVQNLDFRLAFILLFS
jgi:hypothetical protein